MPNPTADLIDILADTTAFLENQPHAGTVPQAEFDQMLAEASFKLGKELTLDCLRFFRDRYGWPFPDDKRGLVGAALAMLMLGIAQGWFKIHRVQ